VLVLRIIPVTIALMGVPVGYVFYQAAVSVITGPTKGTVLAIGTMVAVAAHLIQSRVQDFPSSQLGMDPAISDKYQFV